jgi:hypothetical protein
VNNNAAYFEKIARSVVVSVIPLFVSLQKNAIGTHERARSKLTLSRFCANSDYRRCRNWPGLQQPREIAAELDVERRF